jgi:ferritin-like protein
LPLENRKCLFSWISKRNEIGKIEFTMAVGPFVASPHPFNLTCQETLMPASTTLHEASDKLSAQTIEFHRAIVSLIEELEAVDWYNQRAEACTDVQLQNILKHNRDEEIEHASMALEWIRRNLQKFDEALKTYLFTTGEIASVEKDTKNANGEEPAAKQGNRSARLTVGEMKGG